ncbi:MAG TPA: hypothetical protein VFD84_02350 [Candidatus Binatia bacterium]|nr:hypothetical protein [Candidatus Binatia bacterium]
MLLVVGLVLLLAAASALAAGPAPPAPRVAYADGRLSVACDRVPLADLLPAISRATGIAFRGKPAEPREVTKHFERVPLADALARVLGRQNFVLRYDDDGRPVRAELLGAPLPVPPRPARPVAARPTPRRARPAPRPGNQPPAWRLGAPRPQR